MNPPEREENINILRNFNALQPNPQPDRNNPICKFFLSGNCKNGSRCKFRHSIDIQVELTPKQKVIKEIEDAYKNGTLQDIFKKMLLNENNDYERYYFELHMKFRGWSVLKLHKKSITKEIIDTFKLKNYKLNNEITLTYGFIPLLFNLIINGFTWNTFQGVKDVHEENLINECLDEVIKQLQKRYSNDEYDEIVIDACSYVDPESQENMVMIATHYLCDRVVDHIKDAFKNIKRKQLKELTNDNPDYIRIVSEDFTNFINDETNEQNQNAFDLYNQRSINSQDAYDKYATKRDKAIRRGGESSKVIEEENKRYEYAIMRYNEKIRMFYTSIFNENIVRNKIIKTKLNLDDKHDKEFNHELSTFVGFNTKYGIRCDTDVLSFILYRFKDEYASKADLYMKMLFEKIPNKIINSRVVYDTFTKHKINIVDYLWTAMLNSISFETPLTFSSDLLNEFLKEKGGLGESYICQYLEKLSAVTSTLSPEQKAAIFEQITNSILDDNIKSRIYL